MNPTDPNSPSEGLGRFNVENYLLYRCGLPLQSFTPAQVASCRWFADSFLPFFLLISISYLPFPSRSNPEKRAAQENRTRRFFAKLRTPIGVTPAVDAQEVALSQSNPGRFDNQRLFPNSNWEFYKWSRSDFLGFTLCWLLVFAIIALLYVVVHTQ